MQDKLYLFSKGIRRGIPENTECRAATAKNSLRKWSIITDRYENHHDIKK